MGCQPRCDVTYIRTVVVVVVGIEYYYVDNQASESPFAKLVSQNMPNLHV